MSLFVEYYDADATDNLLSRTGEMDYEYQAEQWAIDALQEPEVVAVKAFYGPRPVGTKYHDRPLFAEWRITTTPDGRQLERLPMAAEFLTSPVPASACPYCERVSDETTSVGGKVVPQPGNWSVCVHCAQVLVYDEALKVRKPHVADLAGMTPETKRALEQAAAMVRQLDRRSRQ